MIKIDEKILKFKKKFFTHKTIESDQIVDFNKDFYYKEKIEGQLIPFLEKVMNSVIDHYIDTD